MSNLPVIPIATKTANNQNHHHRLTQREERVALREWRQEISDRMVAMEATLKSEAPNFQATEARLGAMEERVNDAEEAILDLAELVNVTDAPTDSTNTRSGDHQPEFTATTTAPRTQAAAPPPPQPRVLSHHPHQVLVGSCTGNLPLNIGPPVRTVSSAHVLAAGLAQNPRKTRAHQLW